MHGIQEKEHHGKDVRRRHFAHLCNQKATIVFFMFFPRSLSCAVALVQSIGTVQYCTVVQSTAVQTELSLLSFRPPPSTPAAPQKAFVGPVVLWQ